MTLRLRCGFCGFAGQLVDPPAEVRRQVAADVGHPMPTLSVAIAHICCPRCDEQRLALEAGLTDPPGADDCAEGL